MELLQVEEWINPSLIGTRKGESKIRVGREVSFSNIISNALSFTAACANKMTEHMTTLDVQACGTYIREREQFSGHWGLGLLFRDGGAVICG